jgi:hypothetical protein
MQDLKLHSDRSNTHSEGIVLFHQKYQCQGKIKFNNIIVGNSKVYFSLVDFFLEYTVMALFIAPRSHYFNVS